jgi:hypothetical protein
MSSRHAEFDLTNTRIALSQDDLLPQLLPGNEHGPDNQRAIGTVEQRSFNLPIEWQSPHRAGWKAEGLEYSPDVLGQSSRHADELSPCAQMSTRAMTIERFDVNRPVPACANDLSQSLVQRVPVLRKPSSPPRLPVQVTDAPWNPAAHDQIALPNRGHCRHQAAAPPPAEALSNQALYASPHPQLPSHHSANHAEPSESRFRDQGNPPASQSHSPLVSDQTNGPIAPPPGVQIPSDS